MRTSLLGIAVIACCHAAAGCGSAQSTGLDHETGENSANVPCHGNACPTHSDQPPDPGTSPVDPNWQSQPQLTIFPETLMFYGDTSSTRSLTEQTVTITNKTPYRVMLTRALIVDDARISRARGDQAYFSVDPLEDHPMLEAGASYQLQVRFNADPQQRTALLRIETTHPSYNPLMITLYGKYFTGW